MANRQEINELEREFEYRWHEAHRRHFEAEVPEEVRPWRARNIAPHASEAKPYLDDLRRTRDLSAFQLATDRWMRSFESGYGGIAGQMIINQINKLSPDPDAAAGILIDALTTPLDLQDAARKIRLLADHLQSIRVGAHPSPSRAPFVASYYWGLDAPESWPVAWPKSMAYLSYLSGGSLDSEDQGERYAGLYRFAMDVDGDPLRFEQVAAWWDEERPVFLDDVLCDRAVLRASANRESDDPALYRPNAKVLVAVSQFLGTALEDKVADAAGRTLKAQKPSVNWDRVWPRGDMWVDWRVPNTYGLGIRLWVNTRGAAIGLRPYPDGGGGAPERLLSIISDNAVDGYDVLKSAGTNVGEDVGVFREGSGEIMYGRWFERDQLDELNLNETLLRAAHDLAPLIGILNGDSRSTDGSDELDALAEEFRASTGYPTEANELQKADGRAFGAMLQPDELGVADRVDLRRIWSSGRYGGTGPQSVLNTSLRDADEVEYARILQTLRYLCWGEEEPAVRIDRVLTDPSLRVKGLGESVIMKLLAVTHPDRFLLVYPYDGSSGKLKMLKALGITPPVSESRGVIQVAANDLLRERVDRLFPNDPLGMTWFLYWLLERQDEPETPVDVDPLADLADELLIDRTYIDDVVALLEDKKQVVFYGPPGTGKTYFARKLAETLVPDIERRPLVQFHPSTSYEDFFEGYRPETDANGTMTYRLQAGPLRELADRAKDAPGRRHLMIIDEINRANLPKVLGEMLFLLEYRNVPVKTLYRPDDPFELSPDIWFIGTMNTADRSIALVDAALRRRFHFVPFFPNYGMMEGLLDRWLAREGEPAWVGELVAQVNAELEQALGGPHLQLGPSYFMKHGLDEASLKRIWKYNIEPFIEDQFFGDQTRIDEFRFDQVWARFKDLAGESIAEDDELPEG